tara:strand:+ start:550 stop:1341 length:792 start_codon:yes stop_codon:yes gene_type:complete
LDFDTILLEKDKGVMTISMNRPDRLNAWTRKMGQELEQAISIGNSDPDVLAFVFTGVGRGFCAGADVKDVFEVQSEGGDTGTGDSSGNWVDLIRDSKPVVAAINGAAIGVGLTQVLPMDFIVSSTEARLSCRFVKMGLVPELASSQFLVARCGFGAASELMLSGRTITADEALRIRLVDRVLAPEDLLKEAHTVAISMGENPPAALRKVKTLITDNMVESDLGLVQSRELKALSVCYDTPEHKEAINAFLEKRRPDFKKIIDV